MLPYEAVLGQKVSNRVRYKQIVRIHRKIQFRVHEEKMIWLF
jgi:hypothetical protein